MPTSLQIFVLKLHSETTWFTPVAPKRFLVTNVIIGLFSFLSLNGIFVLLLFFAVISEIPFNIAVSGCVFYPLHQNVIWTFLIAIFFICVFCKGIR